MTSSNPRDGDAGYTTIETENPVGMAKVSVTTANATLLALLTTASATVTGCKKLYFRLASGGTIYWNIGAAATTGGVPIVGPVSWELGCEVANLPLINFIAGGTVALEVLWTQ